MQVRCLLVGKRVAMVGFLAVRRDETNMFTAGYRDQIRYRVLELARADPRVTGGALTGSMAHGGGDEWSDIDTELFPDCRSSEFLPRSKFFLIGVVELRDMHASPFVQASRSSEILRIYHQLDSAGLSLVKRTKALMQQGQPESQSAPGSSDSQRIDKAAVDPVIGQAHACNLLPFAGQEPQRGIKPLSLCIPVLPD
jgi:hypothetical protein